MLIVGVEVFLDGQNCLNHNFIINEIRWMDIHFSLSWIKNDISQ